MRLWIFSDLHLEMQPDIALSYPDADVAVIAGDVHRPMWQSVQWLADNIAPFMPVVFVPGNHEYYAGSVEGCNKRGQAAAAVVDGVCLLQDSTACFGDVRFVGSTLWTDYALGATSHPGRQRDLEIAFAMNECGSRLRDHTAIAVDDSMLEFWQPQHARAAHLKSRGFIESTLRDGYDGQTVVVTHHAPHPASIDRQYEGSLLNPAFASDLGDLIWECQPTMWIHGHMHNTSAFGIGETQVIYNPRGYGGENPAFDPGLVVTVPRR
jgi:Icc-related predicted phosphoesterase